MRKQKPFTIVVTKLPVIGDCFCVGKLRGGKRNVFKTHAIFMKRADAVSYAAWRNWLQLCNGERLKP